jgi:hypothetical protein
VRITEEDTIKITFRTRYGQYEFVVVSFGLANATATFTCLMNGVFIDFLDKFVIALFDEIIIYSKTKKEHEKHFKMVLQVLREHQLYAKLSKCTFFLLSKIDPLFRSHCFRRWNSSGSRKD